MQGEFDYDESVDVFLNVEGATPVAMRGVSFARAIQVVVDQWPPSGEGSVLINRDAPISRRMTKLWRSTSEPTSRVLPNPTKHHEPFAVKGHLNFG